MMLERGTLLLWEMFKLVIAFNVILQRILIHKGFSLTVRLVVIIKSLYKEILLVNVIKTS